MKTKTKSILGILRHTLTFAGGFIVASGQADTTLVNETAAVLVTAIGLIWSLIDKANRDSIREELNKADHGFDKPGL